MNRFRAAVMAASWRAASHVRRRAPSRQERTTHTDRLRLFDQVARREPAPLPELPDNPLMQQKPHDARCKAAAACWTRR